MKTKPVIWLNPNWEENLKERCLDHRGKLMLAYYKEKVKAITKLIIEGLAVIK